MVSPDLMSQLEAQALEVAREYELAERRCEPTADGFEHRRVDVPTVAVEFAGSPKAGKTSAIDIVQHFFHRMGFRVWAPTEGASKRTPSYLRKDLVAFNTWGLSYSISELLIAHRSVERPHLLILDRGPHDALGWMRLLRDKPQLFKNQDLLGAEEYNIIERFALNPRWRQLLSRIYLFTSDPQISLEREHRAKLTQRGGTAMNEPVLAAIREVYLELTSEFAGQSPEIRQVDTTVRTTAQTVAFDIASDVITLLADAVRRA
jgi:hypothetical protein